MKKVVKCKECKYNRSLIEDSKLVQCSYWGCCYWNEEYCDKGEPREEEDNG